MKEEDGKLRAKDWLHEEYELLKGLLQGRLREELVKLNKKRDSLRHDLEIESRILEGMIEGMEWTVGIISRNWWKWMNRLREHRSEKEVPA